MKKGKSKETKCKMKECLNYDSGKCAINIPTMLSEIVPNKTSCIYYDNDFEKTCEKYKNSGGTVAALLRRKGKKTPEELKDIKKTKRKPRADKGKPRKKKSDTEEKTEKKQRKPRADKGKPRKKKENNLKELMG